LLVGLLLALLWNVRERFGPTATIEEPQFMVEYGRRFYSASVQTKLFNLLDTTGQQRLTQIIGSEQKAKEMLAYIGTLFYDQVYAPANTPITAQTIDEWSTINSGPDIKPDVMTVLNKYFVTPATSQTSGTAGSATSGTAGSVSGTSGINVATSGTAGSATSGTATSGTSGSATQLLPSCPAGFTPYVDEQGENMCYKETPARCRYNGYTDKGGAYCENSEGSRDSKCSYLDGDYFPQTKMCRKKEYPRCPDGYHNLNGKCRSNTADEEEYQAKVAAIANSANVNPSVEAPTERMGTTIIYNQQAVEKMWNLLTPTQQTKLVEIFKQLLNASPNNPNDWTPEKYAKMFIGFTASSFYNEVYVKKTTPITEQDVDTALSKEVGRAGPSIKPSMVPYFRAILLNYFKGPGSDPGPGGGAGSGSGGATGSAGSAGSGSGGATGSAGSGSAGSSSSGSSAGSGSGSVGMGGGDRLKQVFGPLFTGIGEGGTITDDSSSRNRYPELLGGRGNGVPKKNEDEKGAMPTIGGLGGLGSSRFFPFSRVPGDMEKIPDPYRVSQTFTAANYSFKTDPVPFLTDFSAFFK
jgi:hypothetical protein